MFDCLKFLPPELFFAHCFLNLRERINAIPYNKRNQLIPNCKETIKLLNQYPFEISNLRNDKDIVKESDSDETIKEYENLLRQLIKLYKEIDSI